MNLFLDARGLLAAAGSLTGASRALFLHYISSGWTLMTSPYAINEVLKNIGKLPASSTVEWLHLRQHLKIVDEVVSIDRPVIFAASKDRPILFTALAWADVLLTLDKKDFADVLGGTFYGLRVMLPYEFLKQERAAGRL